MTWLVAFFMINNAWVVEGLEIGTVAHCNEAVGIMMTAPLPYTDAQGRTITDVFAFCVVPEETE